MSEVYGIENLIKVIDMAVESGIVIPRIVAGKGLLEKVTAMAALSDEIYALVSLKPGQLKPEYNDLSEDEKTQINKHVKEKYNVEGDKASEFVTRAFNVVMKLGDCVTESIKLASDFKKKEV
jgi:hypothetical protein